MANEIVKIVIPSHKRWDRVTTTRVVAHAAICVPKSQADAYRRHNPDSEIIEHPDTVVGLPAKLQWIYTAIGSVFCIDDDCVAFRRTWNHNRQLLKSGVPPECAHDVIQATALAAKHLGCFLFGFATNAHPMDYAPTQPFKLTGYVNSCSFGLLAGSKLFFDTSMRTGADYWLSCLNAHFHRYCFIDKRFGCQFADNWTNPGGLSEFRTIEAERGKDERLQHAFGVDVIQHRPGTTTPHGRLKHQWQIRLNLPF